jgi:class 3 adenylate cyclase
MAMVYRRVEIDGDALVVSFDMCSSSTILEQLTLTGDLARYDGLLVSIKEYLAHAQEAVLFDPYKFTGDGWILLFPRNVDGTKVFTLLRDFCQWFKGQIDRNVLRHLATPPKVTGLTFGIEKGPLRGMTMYGRREYFGRALNVACRLQASIKDNDGDPAYKALVSNGAFAQYFASVRSVKIWKVRRKLRNIQGGADFYCKKIEFLNPRAT